MPKPKLMIVNPENGEVSSVGFKLRRRVPLPTTPRKALQEAASVYAAARRGEVPVEVATRFVYMARQCTDIAEVATIEPRLAAIEERLERIARRVL